MLPVTTTEFKVKKNVILNFLALKLLALCQRFIAEKYNFPQTYMQSYSLMIYFTINK